MHPVDFWLPLATWGEAEVYPGIGVCLLAPEDIIADRGYPRVSWQNRQTRLARLVLEIKMGRALRPEEETRHICDCSACVLSDHLVVGTHKQNMEDRKARDGYNSQPKGADHHRSNARLAPDDVHAIRQMYRPGSSRNGRQIAAAYGISYGSFRDLIARRTWAHI
jgi:hypothetical protein